MSHPPIHVPHLARCRHVQDGTSHRSRSCGGPNPQGLRTEESTGRRRIHHACDNHGASDGRLHRHRGEGLRSHQVFL
ncbi:unnamed protein product [Darwinula stevensoni]|uniref:Uncharacterized protein n=1 Tax=Darwinula stevensoni TaxID=69355 RepID=A0A7R9AIX2_9CRUS|nr:unnamed protein product [Darwinula stevensoni]CAG0907180.1 unnamed protein product [Darwinula stevensoni]